MSNNCKRCGRYLALTDSARCQQCLGHYHKKCVSLPLAGAVSSTWTCPTCLKNNKRTDGKTDAAELRVSGSASPEVPFSSPVGPSHYSTRELTGEIADELRDFMSHIRSINGELKVFRDELTELRTTIKAYHKKVDMLEARVSLLESQKSTHSEELSGVVARLQCDLRERDQQLLANDVEIVGLPEVEGENQVHLVLQVAVKLGVKLEERDIDVAERVGARHIVATGSAGPRARPRPLVVRLTRRGARDDLLHNARVRRGATSAGISEAGEPARFYVNERLSKDNRQLFRQARNAGEEHGWKYVWVKNGRILARNKPGDRVHVVRSEADILRVFNMESN